MKKLSIVIAAYKASEYFRDTIDSIAVASQGLDVEVLIGVDACEETEAWLVENRPAVRAFRAVEHSGPFPILNALAQEASGDWLCVFGADDVMHESMLRVAVAAAKEDVDIVRFWYVNFRHGDPLPNLSDAPERREGAHGNFLVRRDKFLSINGFDALPCGADTCYHQRAGFAKHRTRLIRQNLFSRRVHPQSLTQNRQTGFGTSTRARIQREVSRRAGQRNFALKELKTVELVPLW